MAGAEFSRRFACALNHCPVYGSVSPIARIHGSRNQEVEMKVAPLTIAPSDSLATVSLLIPTTSRSAGPRGRFQRDKCFHQETQQWFN